MPEEILENQQPVTEPKSTNWPKIILVAVLGFGLLAGSAYIGYWYGIESSKPPLKTQTKVTPTPTPTPEPTDETKVANLVKKQLDTCGALISYPDKSFTKTTIKRPPTGEEVVNSYRWAVQDSVKNSRVDVVWRSEGGFDPSVGEAPLAHIQIKCYSDAPTESLEEFKDYVVSESENVNFSSFEKYEKWGTSIYKISYNLIDPAWAYTHILRDYFVGKYDKMFIFVLGGRGYIINRGDFRGYWPEETVIETNVSDLNKELGLIFDSFNFR